MENPCLTFVTPSLIAGDRSQTHVIAHEIIHSWFGNTVTCLNWEHIWLNEGITNYMERRILETVRSEDFAKLHAMIGYVGLQEEVKRFIHLNQTKYTGMVADLSHGDDPEEFFSEIAYEK
jgi:leukotriene-A4 hydrolase